MILATVFIVLFALPAYSQIHRIDYIGFGWEDGGFPTSEVGDELQFTGLVDAIDPAFGVDLEVDQLTFHVYGLLSSGEVDMGFWTNVSYTDGYLEIYQDSVFNAD